MIRIAIIVSLVAVVGFYMSSRSAAVEVSTAPVAKGDLARYVEELGTVKSKSHVNIYAPTAGMVAEVLVDIGDKVEEGDILVKLNGEQLSRQIAELEAQKSAVLAQYNEAKKPADPRAVEKLELEIEDMEKNIKTAEETANNKKALYDAGAISNEEYQNAIKNLDTQRSNLEKAKLDLGMMKKTVSENIIAQYEAQLKQLDIQREGLEELGNDYTIVASMKGTVLSKLVEKGSYLQPGMHIMELGNTEELYMESDVLVGDIAAINEGAKVHISNKDLGIENLEGVVEKIHPNAFNKISDLGIQQKRIKVDIEMKDATQNLRPGYDLDIKIITEHKENILLIPENAVFTIDEKEFVFVNENNKAVLREVKLGIESERQVEVVGGLEEGEMVILSPDENIKEGINIKGQ